MALKLDMYKAYGRVEWNFLQAILWKIGLCDGWVEKVMNGIRSVTFSILLNSKVKGSITSTRGLRQ